MKSKLDDLYSDFFRIDVDARGGYARVAEVKTHGNRGLPSLCAFKLLRHEIDYSRGLERFENEITLLAEINGDGKVPHAIPRIYDSGFAPVELSQSLHNGTTSEVDLEIISTGTDIKEFHELGVAFNRKEDDRWLPYLVVELAPYDDSLLRQVRQSQIQVVDPSGLYRLPTGEVIVMTCQLLDVMDYLHTKCQIAYMDWKPEHIFWNGLERRVKLIDWNVTTSLDDAPGRRQNVRDDLRLLCGAVLYIGLTFIDPDDSSKPIGPRPTTDLNSPVSQIRRRYLTDNADFYQRDASLSDEIKKIIRRGLDPKQGFESTKELKDSLLDYAQQELGVSEDEIILRSKSGSPYFKALTEVRQAQQHLLQAQQHLIEAVGTKGKALEFTRLFNVIKRALMQFPAS